MRRRPANLIATTCIIRARLHEIQIHIFCHLILTLALGDTADSKLSFHCHWLVQMCPFGSFKTQMPGRMKGRGLRSRGRAFRLRCRFDTWKRTEGREEDGRENLGPQHSKQALGAPTQRLPVEASWLVGQQGSCSTTHWAQSLPGDC